MTQESSFRADYDRGNGGHPTAGPAVALENFNVAVDGKHLLDQPA
jgi:hypothetical protein